MKALTTLSIRFALTLAMLLSATVATGCDSGEQPMTLQVGNESVPIDLVQPSPAIQCQNGRRLISVWTKPNAGNSAVAPVELGPDTDQECHPGQAPQAPTDGGALAPGAIPAPPSSVPAVSY